MKRELALVGILLGSSALAGCRPDAKPSPASTAVVQAEEISVDELAKQIAANTSQAVDANGDMTRKRMGTIPGAVLLSDYEAFAIGELPADKSSGLVFYCANEYCGASHSAAKRARFAGYTNVKVLPAGIAGWVKAGNVTTKL